MSIVKTLEDISTAITTLSNDMSKMRLAINGRERKKVNRKVSKKKSKKKKSKKKGKRRR